MFSRKFFAVLMIFSCIWPWMPTASGKLPLLRDIQGHEFNSEILSLLNQGVIKGFPGGNFFPDRPIRRQELAILLVNAFNYKLVSTVSPTFTDVPKSHFAYTHIETAHRNNLMPVNQPDRFQPGNPVNRIDLAIIACKVGNREKEVKNLKNPIILAQDGQTVPNLLAAYLDVATKPQNQFINYRSQNGFRVIEHLSSATRGEVAYTLYQLLNPPKPGSRVNITLTAEPDTLNPWLGPIPITYAVIQNLHFPASGRDHNWDLYPALLKEIPTLENGGWIINRNGMELTFRLRESVKFHDGSDLTIDDWAYNLMVYLDPLTPVVNRSLEEKIDFSKGRGAYGLKGFDLLDKFSVKVYYQEPVWNANFWLPGMSPSGFGIYPKALLERVYARMKNTGNPDIFRIDHTLSRMPVGTGAYKILDWRPGSHLILEKFSESLIGNPLMNNLVFRFVTDTTAILAHLISGRNTDVVLGLAFDHARQFELTNSKHTQVTYLSGMILEHLGINLRNPQNPLNDIRVRQAFYHAINREIINNSLFGGLELIARGFFPPKHWAYDDKPKLVYEFNPKRADQLLDEAGWLLSRDGFRYKNRERLTIILQTTAGIVFRENVQLILKAQLREVGIDLDVSRNLPAPILLSTDYRSAGRWPHMLMFGWVTDPLFMGDAVFMDSQIPTRENNFTGMNYYGYINKECSELFSRAIAELNPERRKILVHQAQNLFMDDLPIIPLFFRSAAVAHKKNLAGFKPIMIGGVFSTWNAYNWYFK